MMKKQSEHTIASLMLILSLKKMLKTGRPPNDWDILLKEAKKEVVRFENISNKSI